MSRRIQSRHTRWRSAMPKPWRIGLWLLWTVTCATADPGLASLETIQAQTRDDGAVDLSFGLSGGPRRPRQFSMERPPRLVLDFPRTRNGLANRVQPIHQGPVGVLEIVQAGARTRAILHLDAPAQARIQTEPGRVRAILRQRPSVDDIRLRRGDAGETRILVTLSDPAAGAAAVLNAAPDVLTLDFPGLVLGPNAARRLRIAAPRDPAAGASDVASDIAIEPRRDGVRIRARVRGAYTHFAYQSGARYALELSPQAAPTPAAVESVTAEADASRFAGDRLSMNFRDISTRAALQVIADFTGLNIVVKDSVAGAMTLRLDHVPWDQALDVILRAQGLAMRREDNVILVGPHEELAEYERARLQSQSDLSALQPLQSRSFKLQYTQASDVLAMITESTRQDAETEEIPDANPDAKPARDAIPFLLSSRGSVLSDVRTNTLIVHDIPERLDTLSEVIAQIDQPVRQVMIESRIVNVDDNAILNLGVRFGFADQAFVSGNTPGVIDLSDTTGSITGGKENLITSLPAAAINGMDPASIFFLLGERGRSLLQLELSALEQDGLAETISTPRIITADRREANISQGFLLAFQENSASGATTTSFKEVALSLTVTPRITPDDHIILDLAIHDDSPVGASTRISTRALDTQVRVKNTETVVLGGVLKTNRAETKTKVPLLGDLPILGPLFRNNAESETKSELLIFVTPTLMPERDDRTLVQ